MCLVAYIGEGNKSIELQNLYRITKLGVKSKIITQNERIST